jgi:hypothetical protein
VKCEVGAVDIEGVVEVVDEKDEPIRRGHSRVITVSHLAGGTH